MQTELTIGLDNMESTSDFGKGDSEEGEGGRKVRPHDVFLFFQLNKKKVIRWKRKEGSC